MVIEAPHHCHPFGLRGGGESSIVSPMAAIANAISHAIGQRMTTLPMSPTVVREALVNGDK